MKVDKNTIKKINKWLKNNGFEYEAIKSEDNEFYYDYDNDYIGIPFIYNDENDKDFINELNSLGFNGCANVCTMSLLHEIGHAENNIDLTDKEWREDNETDLMLYLVGFKMPRSERNHIYWSKPSEKTANEWAIEFAKQNRRKVKQLEEILG